MATMNPECAINAYVYVTYASEDRTKAEQFCQMLSRYGFRYRSACEQHEAARRSELLGDAALLVALTSRGAAEAETVAVDLRRGLERRMGILCISLEENDLDHRFCAGGGDEIFLIRYPVGDVPDRHSMALFIHRLFIRHLTGREECFSPERVAEDLYGQTILCAYRAHQGDADACYELGRAYELGIGVPALDVEAAHWIRLAAEQGHGDARIRMGQFRLAGKGIERDAKEAFRLFSLAAAEGDERGYFHCGVCYLQGSGVIRDPSFGVECLKRAAETGYAPALYRLGLAARDGEGMPADLRAAADYLYAACREIMPQREDGTPLLSLYGRTSAVRYEAVSLRQMRRRLTAKGTILRDGTNARPRSSALRALGQVRVTRSQFPEDGWTATPLDALTTESGIAAAGRGAYVTGRYEDDYTPADAARAACELGRLLEQGGEGLTPSATRALVWYRYALRLGSAEAAYRLGDAYRRGVGTPSCPTRGVKLYRLAAERGEEPSQFALAVCLERGLGVEADLFEAAEWYAAAAEAGYAPAQNNLGGCYEHGRGVARDQLTAVEWYARAAAADQPDAICRLGLCYEYGRGVAADMAKAVSLYRAAAELSHPYAHYRLGLCYDHGVNEEPVPPPEAMATHLTTRHEEEKEAERLAEELEDASRRETHPADGREFSEEWLKDGEDMRLPSDPARAVRLYRVAAEAGIPEANYALYLCLRRGRGVPADPVQAMTYLTAAAKRGHVQAACELGLVYMEGKICPRNQALALTCFTHSVEAWRTLSEALRYKTNTSEREALPVGGVSLQGAVGMALYMLGYCALYGLGESDGNRRVAAESRPDGEALTRAVACFREAAEVEHVGAITMLGDLYAYGFLTPETATPEDESLGYYLEAARLGEKPQNHDEKDPRSFGDSPIDALMTLAGRADKAARARKAEGDEGGAELSWVNVWHSFSESAEYGSVDALVGMAECLFYGYGAPRNEAAAMRLLKRAEGMDGGRVVASLWLGDCLCYQDESSREGTSVYLKGLQTQDTESECGPYTLGLRRMDRRGADRRARAELLYRLALRCACFGTEEAPREEAFRYLAEAIRMGHAAALTDLTRMYAYGKAVAQASAPVTEKTTRKGSTRTDSAGRELPMEAYYGALGAVPVPFSYSMKTNDVASLPEFAVASVTDEATADALYYLGECYFYGYGLEADASAAVECYRRVLRLFADRVGSVSAPACVAESAYSLGWCLLYGVGVPANPSEAVKWLTLASRRHAAACYTLGLCHEQGEGVVSADDREAIKYYRKALRLGHRAASRKVLLLEKRLKNAAELS